MLLALSDVVLVAIVNVVCGGLIAIALKWLDLRSIARAKVTVAKVDEATLRVDKTIDKVDKAIEKVAEVDVKVEEVKRATDGMTTKLVEAGRFEATHEERDRVAAADEAHDKREREITKRVDAAKVEAQRVMTTTNGQQQEQHDVAANVRVIKQGVETVQHVVASNVETIKKDVKDVKADVKDVKAEVTKATKEGVQQGIAEAKDARAELNNDVEIEHRADKELDK